MRKDDWTMMAFDIDGHQFMMLQSALENEGVTVVTEADQVDYRARYSRKYVGTALFVPETQKMTAIEIIKQFLIDFQIEASKFQLIS